MTPTTTLLLYCALIAVFAWLGGWLPSRLRLGHTRLELVMSFVSGLMLGVALLSMLPHAAEQLHSLRRAVQWLVGGILVMFVLIRVFHVHAHADPGEDDGHPCKHHEDDHPHRVSWIGMIVGLTIHSLLDGVALGAAVTAGARNADAGAFVGLATFFAIALHKPLDSLAIVSVMAAGGWGHRARMLASIAYAFSVPVGALLFYIGVRDAGDATLGAALAFGAGLFLCIALADLLPEIQFHHHDRIKLTTALLLGVLCAYGIGLLESGHDERTSPLLKHGIQERSLN
ncbi:MAG: ZIP family metal transporter [Planctomycetota bacterium]|jgi:zinc and cadmium transporter